MKRPPPRFLRRNLFSFAAMALSAMGASCGARSGLLAGSGFDVDAGAAVTEPWEASFEDQFVEAGIVDVLPPIDSSRPADVTVTNCPDPTSTLVYVVTEQSELLSFYPPSASFARIGPLACPATAGWTPFSMAVDRKGTAYVLFSNPFSAVVPPQGQLFRVSTLTAACSSTSYVGNQAGVNVFGMSFVGNSDGVTDTLYIASNQGKNHDRLFKIDTSTLQLTPVGDFFPQTLDQTELSGTGDGRLFAFYAISNLASSAVAQVDSATARVIANSDLENLPQGGGWAFAFWGGDFYLFTAPAGPRTASQVTRFRPLDGSQRVVASLPTTIVGAGVSTCAPQN